MKLFCTAKVLSDDEKRSLYDRCGEAGLKGAGMGMGDFSVPFDLWESLFEGMGCMEDRAVDGQDEYYSLGQSHLNVLPEVGKGKLSYQQGLLLVSSSRTKRISLKSSSWCEQNKTDQSEKFQLVWTLVAT
ncbi:hypothetical protein Pint_30777 [Pistacia integerrima]|uniref:Uncharacterized protein n=1 Tax=Pistacia integerrima TaxID=434235 RepID=A0ACC0WYJ4_9ROSI|nr:hypothetical protein Pint_30777 [Pistacia integerrima]